MSLTQGDMGGGEHDGGGAGDLNEALSASANFEPVGEEKKQNSQTLLLAGLAVVALGAGYFLFFKQGPEKANAAGKDADAAKQTITAFLDEGDKNVEQMRKLLKDSDQIKQQFLAYPTANQVPLKDLKTNPFQRQVDTAAEDSEALAKKKQEEERQRIMRSVNALQLQSILHGGATKACMINNTLVQEGQQVDQFTIERINPDSVYVRSGVYRFELKMQR